MTTPAAHTGWLSHNHHLALLRVPLGWEGLAFWTVDAGNRYCVLAGSAEEADRATIVHLGTSCTPTNIDGPFAWPTLPMGGWCQYLDAVRLLEGDPCDPPLRGPDSSPALDSQLAFLDAFADTDGHYGPTVDRWERMQSARLRHLDRVGAMGETFCDDLTWSGSRWEQPADAPVEPA